MNIKKNLLWAQHQLAHFYNPSLEAEVLLAALLKKNRSELKTLSEHPISLWHQFVYKRWVQDRKKNKPVAYIIGYKDFCGYRLKVNSHTLIPRDETEILCDHIIREQRNFNVQSFLDIGTGSGAIACVLGNTWKGASGTAIDISLKALKIARENFEEQKVGMTVIHSDLLQAIDSQASFDVIVANLPYVPENMPLAQDLNYEPRGALFSGLDGLEHIQRLQMELNEKEIDFKELWLEFLPEQESKIKKIFKSYQCTSKKDLAGDVFFMLIEPLRV